jgi:hypothetical protein
MQNVMAQPALVLQHRKKRTEPVPEEASAVPPLIPILDIDLCCFAALNLYLRRLRLYRH